MKYQNSLAWAIVAIVLGTVTAVVLVTILTPTGDEGAAQVVSQLLGIVAPTLAVLVTLRAVGTVQSDVQEVKRDTYRLTNGLLDAKVRAGVADVVQAQHLDPDYLSQAHGRDLAARDLGDPDVDLDAGLRRDDE